MLFFAVVVRIAVLLSTTPVGVLRQEILYLRAETFRPILQLAFVVVLLEGVQLLLPALADLGIMGATILEASHLLLDLSQAVLLVGIAVMTLRAFAPYSRESLAELEVLARRSVAALADKLGNTPLGKARILRRGP